MKTSHLARLTDSSCGLFGHSGYHLFRCTLLDARCRLQVWKTFSSVWMEKNRDKFLQNGGLCMIQSPVYNKMFFLVAKELTETGRVVEAHLCTILLDVSPFFCTKHFNLVTDHFNSFHFSKQLVYWKWVEHHKYIFLFVCGLLIYRFSGYCIPATLEISCENIKHTMICKN